MGIDDWRSRKGQSYGTVMVDAERRVVVDVLPGRSAEETADWLSRHRLLVSVRRKVESNESVMIQRGDLILLEIAKCGRTKIAPAMIAASCAIPAI
ncbi:transposase [Methylocystis echinoides]|uniref:transposase n=1 Tax=Methylocystis echinoides TaxID=29468 RepID=UPI00341D60D7